LIFELTAPYKAKKCVLDEMSAMGWTNSAPDQKKHTEPVDAAVVFVRYLNLVSTEAKKNRLAPATIEIDDTDI
jgi:hypothetical protein